MALVTTLLLFYENPHRAAVLGRSYPLQFPDVYANQGGTISIEGVTAIVSPATFTKDVYLRIDRTARVNPKTVEGLWQVSDLWHVRFKTHAKDDEVKPDEMKQSVNLSFLYDTKLLVTDQGVYFPESSLRLARADSADGPWTVIGDVVLDRTNHTVSILTKTNGHYMIVGGNWSSRSLVGQELVNQSADQSERKTHNTEKLADKSSKIGENQKTKIVYIVATPTPVKKSTVQKINDEIIDSVIRILNSLF